VLSQLAHIAPEADICSDIDIIVEGDHLYDAMLASIEAARSSILLESYILAYDEVGQPLLDALAARAREGLDVRLHVDAFGSLFGFPRAAERGLKQAGVKVRRFHRWQWRDPWRYNRRNHRKLLVVDRSVAYLGGFNIHREGSRRHYGEDRWRDTHVRVFGELAVQAYHLFDAFWRGDRSYHAPLRAPARHVIWSNHGAYGRRRMGFIMDGLIDGAMDRLWLTNPYFVPSLRIQKRLTAASMRGVDVRVLVPAKNDVRLARWASHAAYARLLAGGVRIFEYQPRVLHAKTALADDQWSMIGTSNLDYRSIFLNYEVNLFSADPSLRRALHDQFLADLAESKEILPDAWSRRHWLHYPAEGLGWLARRWL
jgi:cardiolipin synthase